MLFKRCQTFRIIWWTVWFKGFPPQAFSSFRSIPYSRWVPASLRNFLFSLGLEQRIERVILHKVCVTKHITSKWSIFLDWISHRVVITFRRFLIKLFFQFDHLWCHTFNLFCTSSLSFFHYWGLSKCSRDGFGFDASKAFVKCSHNPCLDNCLSVISMSNRLPEYRAWHWSSPFRINPSNLTDRISFIWIPLVTVMTEHIMLQIFWNS